jgi:hypothetical protein
VSRSLHWLATLFLALCLVAPRVQAAAWTGRALPGDARGEAPHSSKESARTDETGWRVSGLDGPPAWFWPELPGTDVTYRAALAVPQNHQLHGLLVGVTGERSDSASVTLLTLTVRDDGGSVLLDSAQVYLRGWGGLDTLWLHSPLDLAGTDSVRVDLLRAQPWSPVWITADDDCLPGNRSWIRVPALGPEFQPLERDLNIRLLTRALELDLDAPEIWAPAELRCHATRLSLPLRVRVREDTTLDSVWVSGAGLSGGALGLTRLGRSAADAAWEEWRGALPAATLLAAGGPVELLVHARDLAGNEAIEPISLIADASLSWSTTAAREDQSWQPGWPVAVGSVLAVPVELSLAAQAHGLSAVVATGIRLRLRGQDHDPAAPDSLLLRLVQSGSDGLPLLDTTWVELADSLRIGWTGACPGELTANFSLYQPGLGQGSRVWLLLDYAHVSQAVNPTAPLLEWFAPDETAEALDVGACSWSWVPLEQRWSRIPTGRLRVDALLESLGCDRGLPFVADFDATYPDLACWTRTDLGTASDPGWQSTAEAEANGAEGRCFFPDPEGAGIPGGLVVDPSNVTSGELLFINSDSQPAGALRDSLFSPWLTFQSGAVLSFSSIFGGTTTDVTNVLVQRRTDNQPAPWSIIATADDLQDTLTVFICEIRHNRWVNVSRTLAEAGEAGELRLAFAYSGSGGVSNGWALDSIRVDPAPPLAGPFDGPQVKSAELGRIHPNPFNPEAVIPFRLLRSGALRLEVFNLAGQRVAVLLDEPFRRAGEYRAVFRPGELASGVYLARLEAAGAVDVRRLVYLK